MPLLLRQNSEMRSLEDFRGKKINKTSQVCNFSQHKSKLELYLNLNHFLKYTTSSNTYKKMHVNRALMKHFLVHMIPGDWEVSAHRQKDLSRDK